MNKGSTNTRWWENYLVRYFLPSVAGMFIVRWLDLNTYGLISAYFPEIFSNKSSDLNSSKLIMWLLFGSLYCYIASYPVLVFHATRVLDFKGERARWKYVFLGPQFVSAYFMFFAWLGVFCDERCIVYLSVLFFVGFQLFRLRLVYFKRRRKSDGRKVSLAYAYSHKVSEKRAFGRGDDCLTGREIVESYKHLREHGNTAFIFLMEIALCPVFWFLLRLEGNFYYMDFSLISIFMALWAFPAALVYLLGQHLERSFSSFGQWD